MQNPRHTCFETLKPLFKCYVLNSCLWIRGRYSAFSFIFIFYHSEDMYWVILNVKINFKKKKFLAIPLYIYSLKFLEWIKQKMACVETRSKGKKMCRLLSDLPHSVLATKKVCNWSDALSSELKLTTLQIHLAVSGIRFHSDNRVGCYLFILVPAVCVVEKDLQGLSKRLLFQELDLPAPSSLLSELKLWQQYWKRLNIAKRLNKKI